MSVDVLHMNNTLPSLCIPYPQCGHCGEDVYIEDGCAYCDGCRLQWNSIGDGEEAVAYLNYDETDTPCGVIVGRQDPPHDDNKGRHYVPGPPKPCILPSGHAFVDHLCPHDVEVTTAEVQS